MRKIVVRYIFHTVTILLWGAIALIICFQGLDKFISVFFSGFATLISAWALLAIYYFQKWDNKSSTAQILLNEIRTAERTLNELKRNGQIDNLNKILPVNSWVKYQHEFVNDLDEDEFNLINNFYNNCSILNESIERIKGCVIMSNDEKIKLTQQMLLKLAELHKEDSDRSKFEGERNKIFELFSKDGSSFCSRFRKK